MSHVAQRTYDLLKQIEGELPARRRDMESCNRSLASIERLQAAMSRDLALARVALGDIRTDLTWVKHRLGVEEA